MTQVLAELEVPGPTKTVLTTPFWQAVEDGRLIIQHCEACDSWVFYPRARCPHCWSDALNWKEASGLGRLKSFSQIWKPGHPGWIPAAPYYVGLVELAEGPTMMSHIITDRPALIVGDALQFVPITIGGHVLPCFHTK